MDIIMPNLDGVSACHLIRQFDPTPIVAMTSNIRTDDIQMYFNHGTSPEYEHDSVSLTNAGMNDVLPKPFTKEGLLAMLEKHLAHLKKGAHNLDPMAVPQVQALANSSTRASLKDEDSPGKSPATTSNWASPGQIPGVSPVGSDENYIHAVQGHPGAFGIPNNLSNQMPQYQTSPQAGIQIGTGRTPQTAGQTAHRRQISDISGGEDLTTPKRQHIYGQPGMPQPPMQPQPLNPMQRPR